MWAQRKQPYWPLIEASSWIPQQSLFVSKSICTPPPAAAESQVQRDGITLQSKGRTFTLICDTILVWDQMQDLCFQQGPLCLSRHSFSHGWAKTATASADAAYRWISLKLGSATHFPPATRKQGYSDRVAATRWLRSSIAKYGWRWLITVKTPRGWSVARPTGAVGGLGIAKQPHNMRTKTDRVCFCCCDLTLYSVLLLYSIHRDIKKYS